MKKTIFVLIGVLFLASSGVVFAEDVSVTAVDAQTTVTNNSGDTTEPTPKPTLRDRLSDVKSKIKQKNAKATGLQKKGESVVGQDERTVERTAENIQARSQKVLEIMKKRTERVHAYMGKMVERFRVAIKRLEILSDRIASRISKTEDVVVEQEANRLLGIANEKIVIAKNKIEDLFSSINLNISTKEEWDKEELKSGFDNIRSYIKEARESVKDAHSALVEVIKYMKSEFSSRNINQKRGDTSTE